MSPGLVPDDGRRVTSGVRQRNDRRQAQTKNQSTQQAINGQRLGRITNGIDNKWRKNSIKITNNNRNINNVDRQSDYSLNENAEDDIMSILMDDKDQLLEKNQDGSSRRRKDANDGDELSDVDENDEELDGRRKTTERRGRFPSKDKNDADSYEEGGSFSRTDTPGNELDSSATNRSIDHDEEDEERALVSANNNQRPMSYDNSFLDDLDVNLLREYIIVDYEISQLEDRGALRIYHEKIVQLEQLERELDMIGQKAEEVAVRSESSIERQNSSMMLRNQRDARADGDSNSSGATGSMSAQSSAKHVSNSPSKQKTIPDGGGIVGNNSVIASNMNNNSSIAQSVVRKGGDSLIADSNNQAGSLSLDRKFHNLNYSTIEEVFNRKIILEKERDRLKKEVELVIIECDRLQLRYKKRDDILDKLFDGNSGNSVENHLEGQLHWLMEQKHYVDLVFFAWKRAETLTSQTCEQFAHAAELVRRLQAVKDNPQQRMELAKNISDLLIKSRQDMKQAQKYNPNVAVPFFTEFETEQFDKIMEMISTDTISEKDYIQISAVIQQAYKRAVSIRLWLEQILQITIAHDSFELAEEYKWIAIQLRKERISLINSKLKKPPLDAMAREIREQLALQQQPQSAIMAGRVVETTNTAVNSAKNNNITSNNNNNNRDSGVESEDIDIEEEIYRLLEMNKSRLEASISSSAPPNSSSDYQQLRVFGQQLQNQSNAPITNNLSQSANDPNRDQIIRERIERRAKGEQPLALSGAVFGAAPMPVPQSLSANNSETAPPQNGLAKSNYGNDGTVTASSIQSAVSSVATTATRLKVKLDEATRQSLQSKCPHCHNFELILSQFVIRFRLE